MNRIVKILMERDGMTKKEATDLFKEVKEMVIDAAESGDYSKAEDIILSELGLEIDYIFDILL